MMRIFLSGSAFFLLVLSGVSHGLWTGRWGASGELEAAAARCDAVAMTLGDWEGRALELNTRQLEIAEVVGYFSRQYVNRHTGQVVSVLLICGRPGPVSVHTPDVCYGGLGYQVIGKPENRRIQAAPNSPEAEYRTARFSNTHQVTPDVLRILWCWRDRGPWSAPDNPRLSFARSPFLYKLYVIRHLAGPDESIEDDPSLDFLQVLLPELQRCLFPDT